LRWLPFSGGKIARLLCGQYEPEQSALIHRSLAPGNVFYDVGAAVGYYSLLAATRVKPQGWVYAFEPDPRNAAYLRRHIQVNRMTHVTAHQMAVSNRQGHDAFARGTGTGTGHLCETGEMTVRLCRLDDLMTSHRPPTHVKIDVEGAELDVLEGARQTLLTARPVLFLSLHGEAMRQSCVRMLSDLRYDVRPIAAHGDEVVCEPRRAVARRAA
jgi:FkbM family methyltransferase